MAHCICNHWVPGGNNGYCELAESYIPSGIVMMLWCPVSNSWNNEVKKREEEDDDWD